MGVQRKGGKKHRKHGRNLVQCARYRANNQREKNKERRARRILRGLAREA